jgi:NAD(P)-dependent dehydrogenase (short-subunit alcohol dehydrogenase family)
MIGDKLRLDGRTVVVAGAGGGGIGTAVCTAAAELGAAVVGIDIAEGPLADARAATVAAGGRFHGALADVRDEEQVVGAMATAVDVFGSVDGLVHVVGGQRADHHWHAARGYPMSTLDEVLALNLRSAMITSQAAADHMIASGRGGSIVHIASIAAFFGAAYNLAYGVAKAGLVSMTKTMALEWGRYGVRVNAIAAGTVRTPRSQGSDEADAARDGVLPLKRRGTPEEIAGAVVFALSDLSSFVTGQALPVDGGSSVRPPYLDSDDIPVFMDDGPMRRRLLGGD